MMQNNWNDWYSGWGWILWFGIVLLLFSSAGNWGYSYRVHRKYSTSSGKNAIDILNERYARGELKREECVLMKSDLLKE
jgi:putative membrane protein